MTSYTIKELENVSLENPEAIKQFIINILEDRKRNLTNVYSPLYRKIVFVQNVVKNCLKIKKNVCN